MQCNSQIYVYWLHLHVSASRNFWPSIVIDLNSSSVEPVEMLTGSSTPAPYSDAEAFTSIWNRSEMNVNCHFLAVKNSQARYGILKSMNFSESVQHSLGQQAVKGRVKSGFAVFLILCFMQP